MLLVKDIFEKIFNEVDSSSEIKVITGYSSNKFVNYFMNCFKEAKLELYIGMSQQGILENDHLAYNNLMSRNPNVKIYYQIKDVPTHIKLIEIFESSVSRTYVGSANFSFDGLFKHNELMVLTNEKTDDLFNVQKSRSVLANSEDAIQVVVASSQENIDSKSEDIDLDDNNLTRRKKTFIHRRLNLRRDSNFYKVFRLPLKEISSEGEGENEQMIITLPVAFETDKYFPIKKSFILYLEDHILEGITAGKFSSEIHIKNGAKLFKEKMVNENKSEIELERKNENEYVISFSK